MKTRPERYFWQDSDPLWYKDAIIYELHVRAFRDSNDDGIGDFTGLTEKLGYLQDLGITAIWLLPFYPSPLKDDGYDVSNYTDIHEAYGTLHDFRTLIREANYHGLRIINELVLNHTSDKHIWFQQAHRATPGSRWRDFYVWSDSPDKYKEARIIFKDFEASNWAWDPVAKAYYWHRFYSHQPDLNFNNPLVRKATAEAVDFWLGLGVSGIRLDAVPYLFEREGTNCENLPETHAFLKELRHEMERQFQNRMFLAEANQWPEDAVAYFGDGDECHMAYNFPLMTRMFMAIRMEDRFPIVDIIKQTSAIPENCQWALFLRNHDELTLEMVTDEERDYMYRVYADDAQARIHLGIRRRLAPLLNNDRRKIELMNGLLFSLPGTPNIYYGDEIGMGDNIYLGGRNGVRTPMQWSSSRNAGFSRANPQQLYLPVNIELEYHYEAVNVEAQQNNPDSLLWWMKRLISLRKRYKALGRGTLEFLHPENRKILAFVRRYQDETIMVLANLSRLAQHIGLDLGEFAGKIPVEAFGQSEFPVIGEALYPITLSPYAFYWFSLESRKPEQISVYAAPRETLAETITVAGEWKELFKREASSVLEPALLEYMKQRHWLGSPRRDPWSSEIQDIIPISYPLSVAYLAILRVEYRESEPENFLLPIAFASTEKANRITRDSPESVIANLKYGSNKKGIIYHALIENDFCLALVRAIGHGYRVKGEKGEIIARPTQVLRRRLEPRAKLLPLKIVESRQESVSLLYGDILSLKLLRQLGRGVSPELEIGRFLTEEDFPNALPFAGSLEYYPQKKSEPITLAILSWQVPNEGNAWRYTFDSLGHFFERVLAHGDIEPPLPMGTSLPEVSREKLPPIIEESIGAFLSSVRLLGQRTAELHLALAPAMESPDIVPEPYSMIYQRGLYHSMRATAVQTLQLLRQCLKQLPEEAKPDARRVLALEEVIIRRFQRVTERKINAMRIRCHGDYHLENVLYTGRDFIITNFGAETAQHSGEEKIKHSPLRDIADMIRSFHYASYIPLRIQPATALRPEDLPKLEEWADAWHWWVSAAFLRSYLELMADVSVLPKDEAEMKILLDAYLLDRAIHELRHEIESRPSWVELPLRGILQMLSDEEAAKILRAASEKAKIETKKKLAKIISEVEQKTEQMTKETEQLVKEAKDKTRTIAKERRK